MICSTLLLGILTPQKSFAIAPTHSFTTQDEYFPTPHIVRTQVRFWEKVFGKYPSTTFIIHDAEDTGRIVDLIDFTTYGKTESGILSRSERDDTAQNFVERYQLAVTRFNRYGRKALRFGAIEKRVFKVFNRHPAWLKRLYRGDVLFRAQRGLADDFVAATAAANAYLPYMERVFKHYNVPTKIARLPFVESMFNTMAMSKVGASGVWQFMPATARNFIKINNLVDERNSVYKATRAAARLLSQNYKLLGSWPLAITAYNHGPSGMRKAVKKLGTSDIGHIINNYKSKSFGFASRNFYSELLAAANVFDRLSKQNKAKTAMPLPSVKPIYLTNPTSIDILVKNTSLDDDVIRQHNPCIKPAAFSRHRKATLPKKYELFVPAHLARSITTALNSKQTNYARK
jgi:membrane-bound lytic murein transglycosylase D